MTDYRSYDRFRNHGHMRNELTEAGVLVPRTISESDLVHLYDITFLAGPRWEFISQSRNYRPSGTRGNDGQFPTTHSKKKS